MVRCEEEAWKAFHSEYFDRLTGMALARSSPHMDASEIVQLTCLRVVRHIKVFHSEAAFQNWLSCLMRCTIIDLSRQIKRRNVLLEKLNHWQESRHTNPALTTPTIDYDLDDALASLPNDDANLIRMKYVEGWSTRELAEHGQTTVKAVESKLARLRKQLKALLTQSLERSHL